MIKVKYIRKFIIHYYLKYKRELPWREENNCLQKPYNTLVSEIMLQQTRVDKVKTFYKKFIKKWPNITKLSNADISEVLTSWSGLGYYKRAINLHSTAKIIVDKYNSAVPSDKKTLKTFPGIGEYTSSAIVSFAYGKHAIIIDTNIRRFIIRIFGLKDESNEKKIFNYAKLLFPQKETSSFAQGIMDFASNICTKIKPRCDACKLEKYCDYTGSKKSFIKKKKIIKSKRYCYSYFCFTKKHRVLLIKRPLSGMLAGLYEVPTSIWCIDDWPDNRYENIKLPIQNLKMVPLRIIKYQFSHFTLYTRVNIIELSEKSFKNHIWIDKKKTTKFPISSLTNKIIDYSFSRLSSLK